MSSTVGPIAIVRPINQLLISTGYRPISSREWRRFLQSNTNSSSKYHRIKWEESLQETQTHPHIHQLQFSSCSTNGIYLIILQKNTSATADKKKTAVSVRL